MILSLDTKRIPVVPQSAFIAPDAWITGEVELAEDTSIFFHAVLRGDLMPIRIGRGTNVQDHCMLHTSLGRTPTILGEEVTMGHRAIVHGAAVGNRVLIGMGAIILDEAVIGDECIIGAGTLITERKRIPPRSMVLGSPGKVVRSLDSSELKYLEEAAQRYIEVGRMYKSLLVKQP